jgi:hypothetical protein
VRFVPGKPLKKVLAGIEWIAYREEIAVDNLNIR